MAEPQPSCRPARRWSSTSSSSARPGRACRRDPAEAARRRGGQRAVGRRAGEGLGGRRAHPVRRRHRPHRPQPADPRLEGEGRAGRDGGDRGPLLLSRPRRRAAHPQFRHAAADEQSRQLHRQPRQPVPLARRAGDRARRRDLSGLCRRRGALRRERRRHRRRHRRHGRRQGRQADRPLHARHGAQGQVHDHRRGRARLADQAADRQVRASSEGRQPQKYGIGLKELWEVRPESAQARASCSTRLAGRSTTARAAARSSITTAPTWCRSASSCTSTTTTRTCRRYGEFQRFKTHPAIRDTFEGGKRIAYGARAITEGGWQSIPKLAFPGGVLVGCAAGFMNVPRIKGSHNAMLSGIAAAEAAFAAHRRGPRARPARRLRGARSCTGPIARDLRRVRNAKPMLSQVRHGARHHALGRRHVAQHDAARHRPRLHAQARQARLRDARSARQGASRSPTPSPTACSTFDRLTNVSFSATNHEEDQPAHLKVADMGLQKRSEHDVYAGPSNRYCPAGVYEWVEEGGGRASSSTRRTACTARPAISRTPTRTSPGSCPRAAAARTIRACEVPLAIANRGAAEQACPSRNCIPRPSRCAT